MGQAKKCREPEDALAGTVALGEVVRATGLSAELIRAWERRYQAVEPIRTPGGSRRYRLRDVERLIQLKAAVDAGNRISDVSTWSATRWAGFRDDSRPETLPAVDAVLDALADLDGRRAEELLSFQLASLGPVAFALKIVVPLLEAIGFLWTQKEASIASEHLGSALLRTMLGAALRQPSPAGAPRVVFATLPGERHELGLLVAALIARGAGAEPVYLGPDLPADEIAMAAQRTGASAVAASAAVCAEELVHEALTILRAGLADQIPIWFGGHGVGGPMLPAGIIAVSDFDDLERRVLSLLERS